MALFVMIASFFACVLSFAALNHLSDGHSDTHHKLAWTAWEWMRTSNLNGGTVPIQLRFSIDALSGVMMLIVTGIGFLIHLYASSYMENDPGYPRFFAYLNLFVFFDARPHFRATIFQSFSSDGKAWGSARTSS